MNRVSESTLKTLGRESPEKHANFLICWKEESKYKIFPMFVQQTTESLNKFWLYILQLNINSTQIEFMFNYIELKTDHLNDQLLFPLIFHFQINCNKLNDDDPDSSNNLIDLILKHVHNVVVFSGKIKSKHIANYKFIYITGYRDHKINVHIALPYFFVKESEYSGFLDRMTVEFVKFKMPVAVIHDFEKNLAPKNKLKSTLRDNQEIEYYGFHIDNYDNVIQFNGFLRDKLIELGEFERFPNILNLYDELYPDKTDDDFSFLLPFLLRAYVYDISKDNKKIKYQIERRGYATCVLNPTSKEYISYIDPDIEKINAIKLTEENKKLLDKYLPRSILDEDKSEIVEDPFPDEPEPLGFFLYRLDDPFYISDYIRKYSNHVFKDYEDGKTLMLNDFRRVFRIILPNKYFIKTVDMFAQNIKGYWLKKDIFTAIQIKIDKKGKEKEVAIPILPTSSSFFGNRSEEFMSDTIKSKPYHSHELSKIEPQSKVLNLFPGIQARYNPNMSDEYLLIRTKSIRDHIFNILAGGNPEYGHWILSWFCKLIRTLGRTEVCICLYSERGGAGKNILFDFIYQFVLGNLTMLNNITNIDSIVKNFNAHLAGKILVVVDEQSRDIKNFTRTFDQLKGMITAKTLDIEAKGKDNISVDNNANFVITTNNSGSLYTPPGGRKYALFEVSEERIGDKEYFDFLTNDIMNQETGDAFLTFALKYECCDVTKIPRTELLKLAEEMSTSGSNNFFKDLFTADYITIPSEIIYFKDETLFIYTNDFYDQVYKSNSAGESKILSPRIMMTNLKKTRKINHIANAVTQTDRKGIRQRLRGFTIKPEYLRLIYIVLNNKDQRRYQKYIKENKNIEGLDTWEELEAKVFVVTGDVYLKVFN
jgi:hypothetical protein